MKKNILFLLFIITTSTVFAQRNGIEYFGDKDIWRLEADGVEVTQDWIDIYFSLDMEKTEWTGFDPLAEGLIDVGFMLKFNRHDKNESIFLFAYNSEFELSLDNWVLLYNEADNAYLFGGQTTKGDTNYSERDDDSYYIATEIFMNEEWTRWFTNNSGGYYKLAVMEYTYGDHLIFILPEKIFQRISEIYNEYM